MFTGEESIRFQSNLPVEELEEVLSDALDGLGRVEFIDRTGFQVRAKRFNTAFANVTIEGELTKGRKTGNWTLTLTYQVQPSALCWVIAILGFLFLFLGLLIIFAPISTKNDVQRAVTRAVRDARNEIEDEREDS